ncbi:MAG: ester cyclase [Dehalococcoidia bacterium]
MGLEHVRAAFERWHALASAGGDLITAAGAVCAPTCLYHAQNGESGGREITIAQTVQARAMYPDLAIDLDHVITTEDRLLVQITMRGTPAIVFRAVAERRVFDSIGAVVARVNEHAEIVEIWPYLNPGAMLTFPPLASSAAPPAPVAVPGSEADAAVVATEWATAATGPELLERILRSAAADCLVHATNADVGSLALLEAHFAIVQAAFPDLTVAFEPWFVAGDRPITQFTLDGTQRGALGIAPPGEARVQSTGAIVGRVDLDRRVRELWIYLAPGMGLIFPRQDRPRRR